MSRWPNSAAPGPVGRTLETVHDLGEVIRALDELTGELRAESLHRTSRLTNRLGQLVNGVLFAGTINVPAVGIVKEFSAPFAAIQLGDPGAHGPLWVANTSDLSQTKTPGPGAFELPTSQLWTFPLSGRALSIVPTSAGVISLAVFDEEARAAS